MNKSMLEIYSDYLIVNNHYATATHLSRILDGEMSHDKITRFLKNSNFNNQDLLKIVKPELSQFTSEENAIVFDDTVEEKPHMDENDIIAWHYNHAKGRVEKGINLLSAMIVNDTLSAPVSFEVVHKDLPYCDLATKKEKRKSSKTKNELLREMFKTCLNELNFQYFLVDSWFSSKENLELVHKSGKTFICGVKTNRIVALSSEDRLQGKFIKVNSMDLQDEEPVVVFFKGIEFPLLLMKKVFRNKDGSTGILYLISNDLTLSGSSLYTIYKKRWKVEEYHKSIKQNASMKKSPARTVRSQLNHIFSAIYSFFKLEKLKLSTNMNHFAMRYKILLKANITAINEWQKLKEKYHTA